MIETHRGITTNTTPKFEKSFKTTINRFGQKTISLPRIDDNKRWAGFPGLTGISRKLAKIIPDCNLYVEPFAGTAKIYQQYSLARYFVRSNPIQFILNDKSKLIYLWLKKEFNHPDTKITNTDYTYCIKKYDSKDTIFLFDPPWYKSYYDQVFSIFDRENTISYYDELLELCKSIKGKFFITTRIENNRMKKSGFKNLLIQSEYVVCGKYPKVLITTNVTGDDY